MSFAVQCLVVLLAPGPSNALLAASGTLVGVRRSAPMITAMLAAYAVSISLLIGVAGPAAEHNPWLGLTLRLVAAAFLAFSAVKLWRSAQLAGHVRPVTALSVFLTTLINPKGLVFAFGIFPGPSVIWANQQIIGVFILSAMVAATLWIGIGALIARGSGVAAKPHWVARTSAVILAVFALILVGTVTGQLMSP